jgi:hypothetical protein
MKNYEMYWFSKNKHGADNVVKHYEKTTSPLKPFGDKSCARQRVLDAFKKQSGRIK